MRYLMIPLLLVMGTAQANLIKPDCTLEKVAKNGAMNAAVGVKGRCDAEDLVEQKSEQARKEVKAVKEGAGDKIEAGHEKLEKVTDKPLRSAEEALTRQ